jgi:hypothetical protein
MKTATAAPDPDDDPLKDVPWYFPTIKMKLADGTYLLKPGKPIQRAVSTVVAKAFNVSPRTLKRLAESGHIRDAQVTPQLVFYYPGEIEEFFRKMEENPGYWTAQRRREYGLLRAAEKNHKKKENADALAPAGEKTPTKPTNE